MYTILVCIVWSALWVSYTITYCIDTFINGNIICINENIHEWVPGELPSSSCISRNNLDKFEVKTQGTSVASL